MIELQLLAGLNALDRARERAAGATVRRRRGAALAVTALSLLWIGRAGARVWL